MGKPASQKPRLAGPPKPKFVQWAGLEPDAFDTPLVEVIESLGSLSAAEDDVEGRDFVPVSQVLPKGRTKADMCGECFQIPSNNGVCGC
jgi:hypothetical protein